MKISLSLLLGLLKERHGISAETVELCVPRREYRSVRLFTGGGMDPGVLYVRPCGSGGKIFGDAEWAQAEGCGFLALYNACISIFEELADWRGRMLGARWAPDAVAEIIAVAVEQLPHPMYVADPGYKIYAMSDHPEMCYMSHSWKYAHNQGYLPLDIILSLSGSRELRKRKYLNHARLTSSESFYNSFMNYVVSSDDTVYGHFFVIEIIRRFFDHEFELADMVGEAVSLALTQNTRFSVTAGPLYEHFIIDVIDGTLTDKGLIASQLEALKWSGSWRFCVLRIEPGCCDMLSLRSICNVIEKKVGGSSAVPYKQGIAAIGRFSGPEDYERFRMGLLVFLKASELGVGMSDLFSDFTGLPQYFAQASSALRAGGICGEKRLTGFSDIAFSQYIRQSAGHMDTDMFIHPALEQLKRRDARDGSSLYDTLRRYVENDRSAGRTAEALYLHRNTLMKRLEKIQLLTGIDLSDYNTVKRLLLSFELEGTVKRP